uniref:DNA-directed RNA polymerase I subunit RPA12 n=1 Tax=Lotharella globosa TaxID=91324 RepID=A0A7S4DZ22_9EUKA
MTSSADKRKSKVKSGKKAKKKGSGKKKNKKSTKKRKQAPVSAHDEKQLVTPPKKHRESSSSHAELTSMKPPREKGLPMFCRICQNMLNLPDDKQQMTCTYCRTPIQLSGQEHLISVSHSALIKEKQAAASVEEEAAKEAEHATINERCPKCSHVGLKFYTRQMRSVDEGSTVFYECPNCGHTYSEDN